MHGMHSERDPVWKGKRYERWKQSATIIVFSLPTDLGKENEKKIQEARINQGEVVILVTSRGLFENVQKEWKQKRGKTKIRGSNIAMNWHS